MMNNPSSRMASGSHSFTNYRMPAEWDPHEATWIGWPHNATDWPGKMGAIQWVYGEIVRKLSIGETVRILVNSQDHEGKAWRVLERVGVRRSRVEFFRIPTNRGWTRDFGPIFLKRKKGTLPLAIADFRFNAWARYADWHRDNQVPSRLAKKLKLDRWPVMYNERHVILEGGSIEVNGTGTLLTTEECLLDSQVQVRNPGFTRTDYERIFKAVLGVSRVLWLGKGIAGDDTHGHIDDVCRFVSPNRVVLCEEQNPTDGNYGILQDNKERLREMRTENGQALEVIGLPMPAPVYFRGRRLPASYANFYIGNRVVLVPTFNDSQDRTALGILSELFPERVVMGIHALDLVWGYGTLHCLTQQQPMSSRT